VTIRWFLGAGQRDGCFVREVSGCWPPACTAAYWGLACQPVPPSSILFRAPGAAAPALAERQIICRGAGPGGAADHPPCLLLERCPPEHRIDLSVAHSIQSCVILLEMLC
jgi:hypothetical protein